MTTGHKDYLSSRAAYVDEWTQWIMDDDPNISLADARAQAESECLVKLKAEL